MKTRVLMIFLPATLISFAQSHYINKVYEYVPAPGQFVNDLPVYEAGDTADDMIRKAEESIAHNRREMITLGGYGGYVVFGFDHAVQNVPGKYDFRILGNAFLSTGNPNPDAPKEGGSSEPAIVMVSYDANGNGLPDDAWYELAGSEYNSPETVKNYRITYARPDENKERVPHPDDPSINDATYIRWTTNGHGDGYLYRNIYHHQSYYPQWIAGETLSFEGAKLAGNAIDESGKGSYYVQYMYPWGYADNHPNADPRSCFNIEWAVDAGGNPAHLPAIHFVKAYNGVNQYCGWLGETSTEIMGAEDLHLLGDNINAPVLPTGISLSAQSLSLEWGETATATLTATVLPANTTYTAVAWQTSNARVATVTGTGNRVAVTAKSAGTAVITAVSRGYFTASCTVTVTEKEEGGEAEISVTGVTLNKTALALPVGGMEALRADVTPANARNRAVRWSSSNPEVAEVTVNGLVFAKANGQTTITVSTNDGGFKDSCALTVDNATGRESVQANRPQAHYASQTLYLSGLAGYDCTVVNLQGQVMAAFRVRLPEESRRLPLPAGVYILSAQNRKERIILKWRYQ
jgi:uncharacterized protein YjdB